MAKGRLQLEERDTDVAIAVRSDARERRLGARISRAILGIFDCSADGQSVELRMLTSTPVLVRELY